MTTSCRDIRLPLIIATALGLAATAIAAEPTNTVRPASGKSTPGQRTAKSSTTEKPADSCKSPEKAEPVNPGVFLLRDPLVQSELQLTNAQKAAAAELAVEFNESIWRFRDASIESDVARREARIVNSQIEPKLESLLDAGQRKRLAGIALQVQGTQALSYASTVERLSLTRDQQEKIAKLTSTAQ